jgi:hypothetical protein
VIVHNIALLFWKLRFLYLTFSLTHGVHDWLKLHTQELLILSSKTEVFTWTMSDRIPYNINSMEESLMSLLYFVATLLDIIATCFFMCSRYVHYNSSYHSALNRALFHSQIVPDQFSTESFFLITWRIYEDQCNFFCLSYNQASGDISTFGCDSSLLDFDRIDINRECIKSIKEISLSILFPSLTPTDIPIK